MLRDKLIASGRALIETGGFANTSMADIAREAGCSVGALYFRFHDKKGLFDSVVEVAMQQATEDLRVQATAGKYDKLSLEETVSTCVQDYVAFVKQNAGLLRALYQRNLEDPRYWALVRSAALVMVNTWVSAIAKSAGRPDDRSLIKRAGVAFNFATSVLVYSVLITPPVMKYRNEELVFWLHEMVMHFISLSPDKAAKMHLDEYIRVRPEGLASPHIKA